MSMINKQQLCAELDVSESTIRRLELAGLPYVPVGLRAKRYDLVECVAWLRTNETSLGESGATRNVRAAASWTQARKFEEECKKVRLRVYPSPKSDERK